MIGVIADDLTGAAELGGVGWRHGLQSQVVIVGGPDPNAGLVCVDTDSRNCEAAEAGRRVAEAASRLRAAGADWIYKKVDSVLRGNVTPEIEAIIAQLGLKGALLIPANPLRGRTIEGGRYLIGGKLIHETEFAHDPDFPRTTSDVMELVSPPHFNELKPGPLGNPLPRRGILMGEVKTSAEMSQWAAKVPNDWLPAGGADFFTALINAREAHEHTTPLPGEHHDVNGAELFVCGTTSAAARDFVEQARAEGVPIFSLPPEILHDMAWSSMEVVELAGKVATQLKLNGRAILHVGLPLIEDRGVASMLVQTLAGFGEAVMLASGVKRVYAEGGATAAALARQLGWKFFRVIREWESGVVTLRPDGASTLFTMKPGSYRWPATFSPAHEH